MIGKALDDVPVEGSGSAYVLTVSERLVVEDHLIRIILIPESRLTVLLNCTLTECIRISEDVLGGDRAETVS